MVLRRGGVANEEVGAGDYEVISKAGIAVGELTFSFRNVGSTNAPMHDTVRA